MPLFINSNDLHRITQLALFDVATFNELPEEQETLQTRTVHVGANKATPCALFSVTEKKIYSIAAATTKIFKDKRWATEPKWYDLLGRIKKYYRTKEVVKTIRAAIEVLNTEKASPLVPLIASYTENPNTIRSAVDYFCNPGVKASYDAATLDLLINAHLATKSNPELLKLLPESIQILLNQLKKSEAFHLRIQDKIHKNYSDSGVDTTLQVSFDQHMKADTSVEETLARYNPDGATITTVVFSRSNQLEKGFDFADFLEISRHIKTTYSNEALITPSALEYFLLVDTYGPAVAYLCDAIRQLDPTLELPNPFAPSTIDFNYNASSGCLHITYSFKGTITPHGKENRVGEISFALSSTLYVDAEDETRLIAEPLLLKDLKYTP